MIRDCGMPIISAINPFIIGRMLPVARRRLIKFAQINSAQQNSSSGDRIGVDTTRAE